jgi:small subunit ribosomal protein S17
MSSLLFKRTMGAAFAKVSGLTPFPRLKPPAKSQTRVGVVSSSKMEKTVSVVVERLVKHPRWKKYVRKRKKYKMHHEANYKGNEANWLLPGDVVKMVHTRPKSKTKFWELYASAGGLIKKARVFDAEAVNEKVRERKLEERAARRKMERGFAASGGVEE